MSERNAHWDAQKGMHGQRERHRDWRKCTGAEGHAWGRGACTGQREMHGDRGKCTGAEGDARGLRGLPGAF